MLGQASPTGDTDKIAARLQTLEDTIKGTTNAMVELLRQIQKESAESRENAEKEKTEARRRSRHPLRHRLVPDKQ